jgi:Domain of unknown function (DUF4878)
VGYLSDIARRRIAAVLLIAGVAVAALAITDTGPLFDDPPTEEERAQDAVEAFYAAAAEGDFATYCELLTPAARDQVRANAARLLEEAGQLKCEEILEVAKEEFAGVTVRIRDVSVSGAQARVEANVKRGDTPGVESRTVLLEQSEAGAWRISDPG